MIIAVTCAECFTRKFADIPQEKWDQYQDGVPREIAFHDVSINAARLVVDKICPVCWIILTEETGE